IRLQLPPRRDGELVGQFDERLTATNERRRTREECRRTVERACSAAHPSNTEADTHRVVITPLEWRFQGYAGIHTEIDQVAITRRSHEPSEHIERARAILGRSPHHLIGDAIEAEVVPFHEGSPAARLIGTSRKRTISAREVSDGQAAAEH